MITSESLLMTSLIAVKSLEIIKFKLKIKQRNQVKPCKIPDTHVSTVCFTDLGKLPLVQIRCGGLDLSSSQFFQLPQVPQKFCLIPKWS
jgi:hypothetical protein